MLPKPEIPQNTCNHMDPVHICKNHNLPKTAHSITDIIQRSHQFCYISWYSSSSRWSVSVYEGTTQNHAKEIKKKCALNFLIGNSESN